MSEELELLTPTWPYLKQVGALSTTRVGGVSSHPWDTLNLGAHVGDSPEHVIENRRRLAENLGCAHPIAWLEQVHSAEVYRVERPIEYPLLEQPLATCARADALFTTVVDQPLAIMTADCVPILIANSEGSEVAAVHAGWRGLVDGVVEATLRCFSAHMSEIFAWIGPAIGAASYEVGEEVIDLVSSKRKSFSSCLNFKNDSEEKKAYLNLVQMTDLILKHSGVRQIYGGEHCTFTDERFFSYRRDSVTGRMATLIWRKSCL